MTTTSLVVVGINHKTAPVALLEKLAISQERLPKALHQLGTFEHIAEGAILSTCNRIEVYAAVTKFHGGAQDMRNFLSEFCHVAPEEFNDLLYTYHDEGAARHLFRVTAGIDSMIVGESEILGQVRRSFQIATEEGTAFRILGSAFRRALRAGKRSRTETEIARNPVSVSSAAVELARRAFGSQGTLSGKRVTVVGAGKMGRLAVKALRSAGVGEVSVVNRSEERAAALAEAFGVEPRPLETLVEDLAAADIVISSTTAPGIVIDRALVRSAFEGRPDDKPLFIVDIAVPRDVEPEVGDIPGVVLRDIEDLRGVVDSNLGSRLSQVAGVEKIIAEELEAFAHWERSSESAPVATALVERGEEIRRTELGRIATRLRDLTPDQRAAVEQLTQRIIARFIHSPLENVKNLGDPEQRNAHLAALRELFELDHPPE